MPPVLIACPETMDLVPTGVDVEAPAELELTYLLVDCPSCTQDHKWTPNEAVIVDV